MILLSSSFFYFFLAPNCKVHAGQCQASWKNADRLSIGKLHVYKPEDASGLCKTDEVEYNDVHIAQGCGAAC